MDIKDKTTLNKAVEMFHRMIMDAYEESCPYTYTTSNLRKPPWMTKKTNSSKNSQPAQAYEGTTLQVESRLEGIPR